MNVYQVFRVETDTGVVASVVVACCQQDQKFYAEYFVLYEHLRSRDFRSWHDTKQTGEAKVEKILNFALEMAKARMTCEGLGDINKKQIGNGIADGDDQDIDVLKDRYPDEIEELYNNVKCPCLKELLNIKKLRKF